MPGGTSALWLDWVSGFPKAHFRPCERVSGYLSHVTCQGDLPVQQHPLAVLDAQTLKEDAGAQPAGPSLGAQARVFDVLKDLVPKC